MKILVTGSRGTIGLVVTKALAKQHTVIGLDLPEGDITDYDFVLNKMRGVDIVIHLAHSVSELNRENWRSGSIDPTNVLMEMNVFHAAMAAKVKRLIVASSVHADNFNEYEGSELLRVPGSFHPTGPYGAHKIIIEEMGRFYASRHNVEYIGVRFGGVTPDNTVKTFLKEPAVWLSHRDLSGAIHACVDATKVPGRFAVFYAVSDNDGRIHSTDNPFGWTPQDNSKDHIKV
jgi:uronate dehydrogenase